jgi:hypothetical protein
VIVANKYRNWNASVGIAVTTLADENLPGI